jgi:hypothetical protein
VDPEAKAGCNTDAMQIFFENLNDLNKRHEYHPSLIYNYDETMVEFLARKVKVFVPKNTSPVKAGKQAINIHITIGLFIAADGTHLRPLMIAPSKELPPSAIDVAEEFVWAGSTKNIPATNHHYQPSSIITYNHLSSQSSPIIINHHLSSPIITNYHQSSPIITISHKPCAYKYFTQIRSGKWLDYCGSIQKLGY